MLDIVNAGIQYQSRLKNGIKKKKELKITSLQ